MTITTFEKALEQLKDVSVYTVATDIRINLGLNGTSYEAFDIGDIDINDEDAKQNFISNNTFEYLGDGLVKIQISRIYWWYGDSYRRQPAKQFTKTLLLDVANIVSLSYK